MMKMNSIIHTYPLPLALPPLRAARCFAGLLRTLANLSAKGPSLGTIPRPRFSLKLLFCDNHKLFIM
jgi:hypothetical protein